MDVLIRDAVDASVIAELLTQLGYPSTVEDATTRIAEWRESPLTAPPEKAREGQDDGH
ncbi:hypothetical protein [Actinoallomurus sp. CA-150999]|uniref:hypothetical protein n=1 Tax=Actinoallomurus sp. CA-150999 TaxID=3239887 RepID=UPI003D915B8F